MWGHAPDDHVCFPWLVIALVHMKARTIHRATISICFRNVPIIISVISSRIIPVSIVPVIVSAIISR